MLLQMSDRLVFLDNLLDEIVQLAISGEIEKAGQVFSMLASELDLFFSSGIYQQYTKDEVNDFALRMNHALRSLQIKQKETIAPKKVSSEIKKLFSWYSAKEEVKFDDILEFHYRFESIHPFQDGNGRVGRVLMFKECLKHNIIPFIIEDEYKGLYYRGLSEYVNERGYLRDTCLAMQDKYELLIKRFLGDLLDGNR